MTNPEIIILDEPFSGLDPVNSQILKDVVEELIKDNKIVIFSSHQMSYVEEFCENIAIINHGEIALAGNLKEIKREYGKHCLVLSAMNYSLEQLQEKVVNECGDCVRKEKGPGGCPVFFVGRVRAGKKGRWERQPLGGNKTKTASRSTCCSWCR